jgi:nitroreductase
MNVSNSIRERRSIKRFTQRAITRAEIEQLLDAAVMAPNHRLTQPWRFYVLGPQARQAYGLAVGERKALKQPDAARAQSVRDATAQEYRDRPALIAVAMTTAGDPVLDEENYAATMMAVQNIALAATELGFGTAIKTPAMTDPAARAAVGVSEDQRIVALVVLGEPAEVPPPPKREAAASVTVWRD